MVQEDIDIRQPLLKYTLLEEDLQQNFQGQVKISAVAIGQKLLVCGTNSGGVSIFDLQGFKTQDLTGHSCQVEDLSLDDTETYVASCSADGVIRIQNMFKSEEVRYKIKHKLQSIEINPSYSQGPKDYLTGDLEGCLMLHTKGYYSSSEVLVKGNGSIQKIARQRYFVAFVDEHAVQVYDLNLKVPLTSLEHPSSYSQQQEYFRIYHAIIVFGLII